MSLDIQLTPLVEGPIIPPAGLAGRVETHRNINGPSLVRMPEWASGALASYHLYFADHKGSRIELAYADELAGPWTVHEAGALHLAQTPFQQEVVATPESLDIERLGKPRAPGVPSPLDDCTIPHIASPEVIVDDATRTIRLYYHGLDGFARQLTRVAVSSDGASFDARSEIIGPPYLRVFFYRGYWYGLAMPGRILRSLDGLGDFEEGPLLFDQDMRHAGLWLRDDELWVFYTQVGDAPERILLAKVDLRGDWMGWNESESSEVLRATRPWEGGDLPVRPSVRSAVDHRVNQLRDPFVYLEGKQSYLVYAVGGESGLAIARLVVRGPEEDPNV